jgi:hypothetical protein
MLGAGRGKSVSCPALERWAVTEGAVFVRDLKEECRRPASSSQNRWWRAVLLLFLLAPIQALTLEDLRKDPKLTPKKFASYFSDFQYVYRDDVQRPEDFLASKKGDCDDYATLAALILGEKGYHTHLIAIRMPGLVHVVCYVDETKGYLDFNAREFIVRTVSSKQEIVEIAKKVAKSFEANWTTASEFTFKDGLKRLVKTVTETAVYIPKTASVMTNDSPLKMDF